MNLKSGTKFYTVHPAWRMDAGSGMSASMPESIREFEHFPPKDVKWIKGKPNFTMIGIKEKADGTLKRYDRLFPIFNRNGDVPTRKETKEI
jgi:hypothetical protein